MEVKVLINSLLIILIIYILLDIIPYRYRFGLEKRINNNTRYQESNNVIAPTNNNTTKEGFQAGSLDFLQSESDNTNKQELYDYLLNEDTSGNTSPDPSIKPSNYWLSNDNTPNYTSNVTDIKQNYNIESNFDGLPENNLSESKYGLKNEKQIMEQTIVDKQTKQSSFIDSHTSDSQNTFKPDTWKYKNELPMNGGLFNGLSGFDGMNSSYAVYDMDDLNLEQCDNEIKCKPTDDLRQGLGKDFKDTNYSL
jgi:hypothetical protein